MPGIDRADEQLAKLREQHQARGFRLLSVAELTREPAPPEYLIDGLLEVGTLVDVFGAPSALKSFLALSWVLAVTSGTEWFGRPVKPGPGAYLAGEGHRGYARRVKAWMVRHGDPGEFALSSRGANLVDDGEFAEVEAELSAFAELYGGLSVVAVDTRARFMPGDEDRNQEMGWFVDRLDAIKDRFGCAIVTVAHTGHANGERQRGASSWSGAMDCSFRVERPSVHDLAGNVVNAKPPKDGEVIGAFSFHCADVETGWLDRHERPVTSLVLDRVGDVVAKPRALTKHQAAALREIERLDAHGLVGVADLRKALPDIRRQSWTETILPALVDRGRITWDGQIVRLVNGADHPL